MPSLASTSFLPHFFIAIILITSCFRCTASVTLTYCSGNFTSSSLYETQLTSLLDILVASTLSSPTLYTTSSYPNSSSPQVFGLAQCRPDASTSRCYLCLSQSVALGPANRTQGCGKRKSAVIRSDYCVLRYSDQPFFGAVENQIISFNAGGEKNVSLDFSLRVNNLLKERLTQEAINSSINFAVGVSDSSDDPRSIYGMVWCSMDLKRQSDCEQCISSVSEELMPMKGYGWAETVSCMVRYDTSQFFSTLLFPGGMLDTSPPPELMSSMLPTVAPPTWLPDTSKEENGGDKVIYILVASGATAMLLIIILITILLQRWKRLPATVNPRVTISDGDDEEKLNKAVQLFNLGTIINATNNFALGNKLGQGGFGPVYIGVLPNEQKIAVKRLTAASWQGLDEMKNEIDFIAKLQHKNLVRLLGYCLEGDEKILVYEYLPNIISLDKFISDPSRRMQLDWRKRVKIMVGIACGIQYLHEDSHLKIVHGGLKASNILLDSNMNPTISGFGLAKLVGNNETKRNTSQIVGAFGYMAPEYILHGIFSTKTDVYSYGVLVLEIITGEMETTFTEVSEYSANLLFYVWKHWIEGNPLQVVDKSLTNKYSPQEALRLIQIGLLCVQQEQTHRPNMDTVISMLSTRSMALPIPSSPVFDGEKSLQ